MTELLTRPAPTAPYEPRPARRSMLLSAVWAAFCAAAMSAITVTVVVVVMWATASRGAIGGHAADALRTAGSLWLLGHHAVLTPPHGAVTLLPLGLTLGIGWLLHRAGVGLARGLDLRRLPDAWVALAALAATYGALTAAAALALRDAALPPNPLSALLGGWLLALLAGASGMLGHPTLREPIGRRVPGAVRAAARAGLYGAAALVAVGALLTAVALATHGGTMAQLTHALAPGAVGGVGLALLQLVFLPDAVAWGASYALGPGFSVGAGTVYAPLHQHGGATPALPMLAALPGGPAPVWVAVLLVAGCIAVGAVAGLLLLRRWAPGGLRAAVLGGLGTGVAAAAAVAVLLLLAAGAAGPGRMDVVGASAWQSGLVAAAELGCGGVLATVGWWLRATRPPTPATSWWHRRPAWWPRRAGG